MRTLLTRHFSPLCLAIAAITMSSQAYSQDSGALDEIVTPDIERRAITEDQLDSENWEVGAYGGILNIEEFDSNIVTGVRVAYHMTEFISLELNIGATEVGDSFAESLDGGLPGLNSDDREYSYYNLSFAYNLLPSEVFLGPNTAFKTDFYVIGGVGNTTFNRDDFFTYSLGGGLRFYLTDFIALHATVKNHIYDSDVVTVQQVNNIESTLGVSFYF